MNKLRMSQAEIDRLRLAGRYGRLSSVYGVGCNDVDFKVSLGDIHIWQYESWSKMLHRCFSEKHKAKYPTYEDVTCCDEWLSFANFLEWCNKEVDYKGKPVGFQLDKDIIISGNKTYSPDRCCFVPQEVNKLLTDRRAVRGDYPVGVSFHKATGRFTAQLKCDGRLKYLGLHDTPEEAFATYKEAKEAQVKIVAMRHKEILKPTVFDALIKWSVK